MGRGGGTEQPWRIAKANRPESAVYGDEGAAERGVRANPLANRPAHTAAQVSDFLSAFQFAFGIFAIVSLLTCPMYSPSYQQPKESARINFLPSSP